MKIVLYNHSHNGDQLNTLGIVKKIINDNIENHFIIIASCSMFLYNDLISDRVTIEEHPFIWNIDKQIRNNSNFITHHHDTLWFLHEENLYINLWKILITDNHICISLLDRPLFIKRTLEEINNQTGIKINFNCNDYKELIPLLPFIDIDHIHNKIISYKKKVVFFYNQKSCSGVDDEYPSNIDEIVIDKLIKEYNDYIIILSKPCNINHPNIVNVETEFGNLPVLNGKNLIINAQISNLCNEVYFKSNGGSLFILNQENIRNKNTKYHFIRNNNWKNVYNHEYGLEC